MFNIRVINMLIYAPFGRLFSLLLALSRYFFAGTEIIMVLTVAPNSIVVFKP